MSIIIKKVQGWADVEGDVKTLAKKIIKSDFKFNIILAVARGGVIPAILLSDILDTKEIAFIQTLLYERAQKSNKLRILDYTRRKLAGKKILVVDDVSDSGETLTELKKWLSSQGVSESLFACLHYKSGTTFIPTFYARKIDGWITYPWTKIEDKS